MKIGKELQNHYGQLLGISYPWEIDNVILDHENKRLTIKVSWAKGEKTTCPVCNKKTSIYDRREERTWRHLDTMQFETIIKCRVPRSNCEKDGQKTVEVPWAEPDRRFTLLFERFAIDVLQACKSIKAAQGLLRLSWDEVCLIMKKAVERGKKKQKNATIKYAGIDEKSFKKGHKYISILADIENGNVIDVENGRDKEATRSLLSKIPEDKRDNIEAVAMDMWESFEIVAEEMLPNAERVHDKFHISKYLNEAVDKVRKTEHKKLLEKGNSALKGTKYLWMRGQWDKEHKKTYKEIKGICLKTSRAWMLKETFNHFWDYKYTGAANTFFKKWYFWATHSRLKPVIEVAKMLKRHFGEIITYLKYRITNAALESINSRIQIIKSNARGFRNFENFRAAILFYLGGLDLYPQETQ